MAVNNNTNLVGNREVPKTSDLNDTNEPTKATQPFIDNHKGITDFSFEEQDIVAPFPDTKPPLEKPAVSPEKIANIEMSITSEEMQFLGLSKTNPTFSEMLAAVEGKLEKLLGKDDTKKSLDNDSIQILLLMLGCESKSESVKTAKAVLEELIKQKTTKGQEYLEEVIETNKKNVEAKDEQLEAQAKAKMWGILGAVLSIIAAVVSAVMTVVSFGAAAPLAILVCGLACLGAAATVTGSAITIAVLADPDNPNNDTLNKCAMGLGIAGTVCSLASGITSAVGVYKGVLTAANVSTTFKIVAIITQFTAGITGGVGQIINGVAMMSLKDTKLKLAYMEAALAELDQQIEFLSKFIEKMQQVLKELATDLLNCESELSKMLQDICRNSLNISDKIQHQC